MKKFLIGQAAVISGVCTKTLCRYEKRGLINPERDYLGRRVFSEADLERIRAHRQGDHGKTRR